METIINSVIIVLVFTFVNSYVDARIFRKGQTVNHLKEGIEQGLFILLLTCKDLWYLNKLDWIKGLILISFYLSLFWLLFDYVMIFVRNYVQFLCPGFLPWYHTGDNLLDRIWSGKTGRYRRLALKIALVLITGTISLIFI